MRAISVRPADVRRNSTSLTLSSNLAAGSYAVFALGLAAASDGNRGRGPKPGTTTGRPAAPSEVIFLRKSRRPGEYVSMVISLQCDRERCNGRTDTLSDISRNAGKLKLADAGIRRVAPVMVTAARTPPPYRWRRPRRTVCRFCPGR